MKVCCLFLIKIFINSLDSTHNSDCIIACTRYMKSFQKVYLKIESTFFTINTSTTCFNNRNLRNFISRKSIFSPMILTKKKKTVFLYNLSRLICVIETWCVFCGIQTEHRYDVKCNCPCLQPESVWQAVNIHLHILNVDARRRQFPGVFTPQKEWEGEKPTLQLLGI
jgi:hypothetical protein